MSFDKSLDSQEKKKRTSLAEQPVKTETCLGVLQQSHQIIGCLKVMTYKCRQKSCFLSLSLSHTEHTAYTVGHQCKPYIQPNQPWPYPSYTWAIRVYPWKPCMIFKTFKKTDKGAMSMYNRISDRTRPCEIKRDRTYNPTWSPLHEWAHSFLYDRHTTYTVTVQVRTIHGHLAFYTFSVESSKICEAKPSKRVNFISEHTQMCDNSSITRTKVGGT